MNLSLPAPGILWGAFNPGQSQARAEAQGCYWVV